MKSGEILYAQRGEDYILKFVGDVRLTLCSTLDKQLVTILSCASIANIVIDLTETEGIDSTSLGLIAKLAVKAQQRNIAPPMLVSTNPDVTSILLSMGFDHIFLLLDRLPTSPCDLKQLPLVQESEHLIAQRIIEAHKVLMDLNDTNRQAFKDLVSTLENSE